MHKAVRNERQDAYNKARNSQVINELKNLGDGRAVRDANRKVTVEDALSVQIC